MSLLADLLPADEPTPPPPPRALHRVALEDDILAAFDAPARPHCSTAEAFRHKEQRVAQLFIALSIIDAHHLHRRLVDPQPHDPIAQRLARLTADRATRLVNVLADARRRAAISAARHPI